MAVEPSTRKAARSSQGSKVPLRQRYDDTALLSTRGVEQCQTQAGQEKDSFLSAVEQGVAKTKLEKTSPFETATRKTPGEAANKQGEELIDLMGKGPTKSGHENNNDQKGLSPKSPL